MDTIFKRIQNKLFITVLDRIRYCKTLVSDYPHSAMAAVMLVTFIIFWPTMTHFFEIDDFSWLLYGGKEMNSVGSWFHAFAHINGSGQYRPLTLQAFYWVGYHLFGLEPLGMHLINFFVFLLACWIVYKLLQEFTPSKIIAASASSLFCFSTVHFEHLFWICAFTETLATLCVAGALYAVSTGRNYQVIMWYVIGLLSNESTIVLPVMIFLYYFLYKRHSLKDSFKQSSGIWYILVIYLLMRKFVLGGFGAKGVFSAVYSPVVWLQEILKEFKASFGFNAEMNNVIGASKVLHILIVIICIGIIGLIIYKLYDRKLSKPKWRVATLGALWFLVGLLPVLPFAHNFASYTTSISTIGLSVLLIGLLGNTDRHKFVYPVIALGLLMLSVINMYGPTGLYQTDGYRALARADYLAYIQMQATYNQINKPLYVSVVGNENERGMSGLNEMSQLIDTDSKVVSGYSPNANLTLVFNANTFTFSASPNLRFTK
jgi:hypothetical protein